MFTASRKPLIEFDVCQRALLRINVHIRAFIQFQIIQICKSFKYGIKIFSILYCFWFIVPLMKYSGPVPSTSYVTISWWPVGVSDILSNNLHENVLKKVYWQIKPLQWALLSMFRHWTQFKVKQKIEIQYIFFCHEFCGLVIV